MRYPARLFAAAIALCLFATAQARADFVDWSYNWTPSSTQIFADDPSMGHILLSNEAPGKATGDTFVVASNLNTFSTAEPRTPATFTDAFYSLTLTITDDATGKTDSLVFTGKLNGVLSKKSAILMNEFTSEIEKSVTIGSNVYTVKIGPFAPPGPPTTNNPGSISALATISVKELPEPSTLALAGVCLSVCGGGWWYRRIRSRNVALNLA
jgi:hypothetical protein